MCMIPQLRGQRACFVLILNMLNITFGYNFFVRLRASSRDFIKVEFPEYIVKIEKREFFTKRSRSRLRFFECASVAKIQIK